MSPWDAKLYEKNYCLHTACDYHVKFQRQKCMNGVQQIIIGASLREPHTSKSNGVIFIYIYLYMYMYLSYVVP